jgi:hypothetical protein
LVYNSSTGKWENSSGGYVPYTGAVTTVNLGAQSILAGSFVKAGGTAAQFLKANGSVDSTAYGTGSVTSVALTMPTAFSVAGSPITTAGTLAITGAGTVGQYIRGDGSLADFPATTGGGSSVSYYLNGSVSQGTIGGVAYKELNRTPIFGAGTDITINADGYIASFITDALDPNKLLIPAGNWNFETYFSANSGGGSPTFYVELYKYNGTTFTLIATSSGTPELIAFGTNINPYFSTLAVPETVLALTDRLALRYYVSHSGRTITLHTENGHLCQVITTFTTGLTALNGLTNQVQFFAVGTSGTDFAISSVTDTHTFNLPTASATNRGALSSADWTTFNGKTSNLGTVTSVGLSSATSGVTIGSTPVTTSGTITLAIATASGSQNGLLSSTDWTTFNGKQNALTNPVTGTGTTNYLPKFTGSTTIGNSLFTDNGTNGAFGGANYYGGTDLRSFNISAVLYPGIAFWANNVMTGNIFGYGVTGNIIINADPSNVFSGTKIGFEIDGTERLGIFSNGNVSIDNSPTDQSVKLFVNGTGRFVNAVLGGTGSAFADGLRINRNSNTNQYTVINHLGGATNIVSVDQSGNNIAEIYFGRSINGSTITNSMMIDKSGNVGINTASPEALSNNITLQIDGTNHSFVRTGSSNYGGYFATIPTAEVLCIANVRNPVTGTYNNTGKAAVGINLFSKSSNGYIEFLTTQNNNSSPGVRMLITSTGNVGIGQTSPNARLHVEVLSESPATGAVALIAKTSNGANDIFRWFDGTTQLGAFKNNGNVLIGSGLSDIGERLTLNGRIGIVGATVASGNTRSFFVRGSQNVADGGTLTLSLTNSALIFIAENNTGTGALFFCGYASGTITKISDPSNIFDVADTAGKLCIFKSAVTDVATVKNRLGSTKNITVSYIGVSD